jgi:hypothetical protein
MKSQLTDLNKLLEKNAQVFHQLFDDAQSALQMGRTSSTIKKKKLFYFLKLYMF